MKKPLWIFFDLLRKRSPTSLGIDQYFYFLKTFQEVSFAHFNNLLELREFTKIFWLKEGGFELTYNALFQSTIKWEAIEKELFKTDGNEEDKIGANEENREEDKGKEKAEKEEIEKHDQEEEKIEPKEKRPEFSTSDFIEFDLVISENQGAKEQMATLDIKTPFLLSNQAITPFELRHFAQRLRRKVETPFRALSEELDFEAMIDSFSKNGFINDIIYQNYDASRSNIILLSDRFGSMLAYEYLEHHLAHAISSIPYCQFEHYYFYNLPSKTKDQKHYELSNLDGHYPFSDTSNHHWNGESWFFILSDAGAHSNMINKSRLRATLHFCNYLRRITKHVYWVNPVPKRFMEGTTAQRINRSIPMIYPTKDEWNIFFNK